MNDTGKVSIHGKEYETVASRVQRFRKEHGTDYAIITEIVDRDDKQVVMHARIEQVKGLEHPRIVANGFAEESRTSSSINRTSALENAETSAIGRALANFGMAGTEYASADEVAGAISARQTPQKPAKAPSIGTAAQKPTDAPKDPFISEAQAKLLLARTRDHSGLTDRQDIYDYFLEKFGLMPNEVKRSEVDEILRALPRAESVEDES